MYGLCDWCISYSTRKCTGLSDYLAFGMPWSTRRCTEFCLSSGEIFQSSVTPAGGSDMDPENPRVVLYNALRLSGMAHMATILVRLQIASLDDLLLHQELVLNAGVDKWQLERALAQMDPLPQTKPKPTTTGRYPSDAASPEACLTYNGSGGCSSQQPHWGYATVRAGQEHGHTGPFARLGVYQPSPCHWRLFVVLEHPWRRGTTAV